MPPRVVVTGEPYRPSYLAAVIASAAVMLLYALTLAPGAAMWDAGEYIATAYTMGVPHPPGNPLFVLLGRAFAVLPVAPSPAQRINVLAALCSALSAGLWFLVAERIVAPWLRERWHRIVVGSLAALTGATAFTVWHHSVVNEKVYTVTLLGLAVVSWIAMRWVDEADEGRRLRLLVLAAYLLVLGYTNHMGGLLAAPALAVLVLALRPATLLRWQLIVAAAAVMVLGFTPYATQVVRASFQPAINMGATSACEGEVRLSCLTSAETRTRFNAHLNREQYGKPSVLDRQAAITDQVGMYWLYFRWQWIRDAAGRMPALQWGAAFLFLGLGLAGAWMHWRRDRATFWYFGTLVATLGLGLVFYMNFRLGFSQGMAIGVFDRELAEVRDRDYFFIWSFSTWGVWVAVGLAGIWQWVAERIAAASPRSTARPATPWLAAAPVLLVALIPLMTNWRDASRAGQTFTRDWAHDVLNSVEPYGILITFGDNDTYPLWYAQEVEGIRRDVTVAVTSLLGTDWYAPNILQQPPQPYDSAAGPPLYASLARPHPGPPLRMSPEEARAIQTYVVLQERGRFVHAGVEGGVGPGLVTRDKLLVLYFIRDSFPGRPIYFTAPGGYVEELGLQQYLVREGLLYRLTPGDQLDREGILDVPGVERVDLDRSLALWNSIYVGQEALATQGRWVDLPSMSIPFAYIRTGALLSAALQATGRAEEGNRVLEQVQRIAYGTRLQEVMQ